jgi:hypothetical protein
MWPKAEFEGLPHGPRPGSVDNIIDTGAWYAYDTTTRDRITDSLHRRGYTHVQYGPLDINGQDAYHGQFPLNGDWNVFLDDLEDLERRGFIPIVFIHPDGWTFEQTRDTFTPLLQQERAQRLVWAVVPSGWEPTGYGWSSVTWSKYFQWAREVLPKAMVLMHCASRGDGSPFDAPAGNDELWNDDHNPHGNGDAWARCTPFLHGFLIQFGPFPQAPDNLPDNARGFAGQFDAGALGAEQHGFAWHFVNGINGWPQGSAWGANVPLKLYAGEVTAYLGYWQNMPEADREAWGDLAMRSGAAGYFDGGTVSV